MTQLKPHKIKRLGWPPDRPDQRDYRLTIPDLMGLPASVDLRPQCPPIIDQGELGSCTANAISSALQFEQMKQGIPNFQPSRLFIYYGERSMEGTVDTDAGAMIRDGMKVVAQLGAPPETDWPYDVTQFATKPPDQAYTDALLDQVLVYWRVVQTIDLLRGCLAQGYPFVFGFTVYESFESDRVAQTGIVPMPQRSEQAVGGHAVMAVGYDDHAKTFLIRNSWGSDWGMAGYFTMPYSYLARPDLASDFWSVRMVES